MTTELEQLQLALKRFKRLPWHGCPYCHSIYGHKLNCELAALLFAVDKVLTPTPALAHTPLALTAQPTK